MNECSQAARIQDYLDGLLSAADERRFRDHLGSCAGCTSDLAVYRRVFAMLDTLPLPDAQPALVDRILVRVVPSRVRRRWIRTFGWSYAALLTATIAPLAIWAAGPAGRALLFTVLEEGSRRLVGAAMFTLHLVSFVILGLADGRGLLAALLERFSPLQRAWTSVFGHPVVEGALWMAIVACAALLWWLGSRGKHERGQRVGVLGF